MSYVFVNVEFVNASRIRVFQCHFSVSRFSFPRFQSPQRWHGRREYCKLPAFLPNIQNVVTNSSCWQCLYTLLFRYFISSYYSKRCWNLSHNPSALLTKFARKFHSKHLASAFIFTKLSTKTLLLLRRCVSLEYQGLLQNTPASFLLLFVNVQD